MAKIDAEQLSNYISAFAGSASEAQATMSSGTEPMRIKEYRFKVHLTADFETTTDGNINLSVRELTLRDKIHIDYKEHLGIDIDCTIVPILAVE